MHVLVIEPDRLQAELIQMALRRSGRTTRHAVSAQSAVQAIDERTPDIVILELQLPRHNGVEFLYEFRSYPEWLQIPIIIYSYTPLRELAQAATLYHELGVVQVLYKPETSLAALCAAVVKTESATV